MKVIQVCKDKCEEKPVEVKTGNNTYTFCCKKGFEESLERFAIFMGHLKESENKSKL